MNLVPVLLKFCNFLTLIINQFSEEKSWFGVCRQVGAIHNFFCAQILHFWRDFDQTFTEALSSKCGPGAHCVFYGFEHFKRSYGNIYQLKCGFVTLQHFLFFFSSCAVLSCWVILWVDRLKRFIHILCIFFVWVIINLTAKETTRHKTKYIFGGVRAKKV